VGRMKDKISHHIVPYFKMPDRKPLTVQLVDLWHLYRRYGRLPTQYLSNMLYRKCAPRDILSLMPPIQLIELQERLNDPSARNLSEDKFVFRKTLEGHGLPVVRELFQITETGEIRDANNQKIDETAARQILAEQNTPVFVKPTLGTLGKGAFVVPLGDDIDFRSCTGCIFQPFLQQHEVLAALKPDVINCVRIDTLLIGDKCISNAAVLKIGRGDAPVDNAGFGGLIIQIDIETGRLIGEARQKARFGAEAFTTHPETGASFTDVQVPFWSELRALVTRAASILPELPTLGWDVAITPDGPVLIEVNSLWHLDIMQFGKTGLGDTQVGRAAVYLDRTGELSLGSS